MENDFGRDLFEERDGSQKRHVTQLESMGCLSGVYQLLSCLENDTDHSGTREEYRGPDGVIAKLGFFVKTHETAPDSFAFIHLGQLSPKKTFSWKSLRDCLSLDARVSTELLRIIPGVGWEVH